MWRRRPCCGAALARRRGPPRQPLMPGLPRLPQRNRRIQTRAHRCPGTAAPAPRWSPHTAASPADSTESPAPAPAPPGAGCWRARTDTHRAANAIPANWRTPPVPGQSSRGRRSCFPPTSACRPATGTRRPTRPSRRRTTPPMSARATPASPWHWRHPGFHRPPG